MARQRRPGAAFDSTLQAIVGSTFVHRLTDSDKAHAPLVVGSQAWSTHRLALDLGVVNTKAARLLSAAARSIDARNVRDLFRRSTPYTFAGIGGLGETTLYVLWRLFEAEGLDPNEWAGKTKEAIVTFHTMKKREQDAERRTVVAESRRQKRSAAAIREDDALATAASRH